MASGDDAVKHVYSLLAKRELAASVAAWRAARNALADANGAHLLAMHEAVTDSLTGLLTDIAEHGLQNQALWGIPVDQVDIQAMSDECAASWSEVRRLRAAGITSSALIDPYVGTWMNPIGSREWLNRMRLGVSYRQDKQWIQRVSKVLRGEVDEDEE